MASFNLTTAAQRSLWQLAAGLIYANHQVFISTGQSSIVSFWFDAWAGSTPLKEFLPPHIWNDQPDKFCSVAKVLSSQPQATIAAIRQFCPPGTLTQLVASTTPHDAWMWTLTTNGAFSTSSVRRLLSPAAAPSWALIWHHLIPIKWSILTWRIMHGCLPVDSSIMACGVPLCSHCNCYPLPSIETD